MRARTIGDDGTLGPAKTLAPRGNSAPLVDFHIGARGEIGVLWFGPYRSDFASRPLHGRFGTVARGLGGRETVPFPHHDGTAALSFAGGRARVTYPRVRRPNAAGNQRVRIVERKRIRPRRYVRERTLARPLMAPSSLRFGTGSEGHQAATWWRSSGSDGRVDVYATARRPGRPFDRPRNLGPENPSYYTIGAAAIDRTGNVLLAWPSLSRGYLVTALGRSPAGFGPLTAFTPQANSVTLDQPVHAVDSSGHGLLAWSETPIGGRPSLVAAFRSRGGRPVERRVLVGPDDAYGYSHQVTLDRAGRGSVAYIADGRLLVTSARLGGG